MKLWRICQRRYAAFDGKGASLAGGRWNRPGMAVVYASGTLSLAVLEVFVHADADLLPPNLVTIAAEIPDESSMETVLIADLPPGWREYPPPERLQDIGSMWALEQRTLLLSVPSAVVPEEHNYLINPNHPQFARVSVGALRSFSFDTRLIGR